jgi:hypothetical protein
MCANNTLPEAEVKAEVEAEARRLVIICKGRVMGDDETAGDAGRATLLHVTRKVRRAVVLVPLCASAVTAVVVLVCAAKSRRQDYP